LSISTKEIRLEFRSKNYESRKIQDLGFTIQEFKIRQGLIHL